MTTLSRYLDAAAAAIQSVPRAALEAIAQALWATYERDGTIFVCGNGGSAATAQHLACDLSKATIWEGKRRVRCLALNENMATLTAWANDAEYRMVFLEQLVALAREGDALVLISGSGDSKNVRVALAWAQQHGLATIALTGMDGGTIGRLAQYPLIVPCHHMPAIEDAHSAICHALTADMTERVKRAP